MIQALRAANRLAETIFMLALALFCVAASLFRRLYLNDWQYFFLNWNLFLAFIPWALTSIFALKRTAQHTRFSFIAVLVLWLIFFPNALYIFTNLFHLRVIKSMPIWYDLVMILLYAWTGMLFGFLSLWDIERVLLRKIPLRIVTGISMLLLFAASFGIYLGRYLRYNTWDIFMRPLTLFTDISGHVINPLGHQTSWGFTLFMGLFLIIVYWSFKLIKRRAP